MKKYSIFKQNFDTEDDEMSRSKSEYMIFEEHFLGFENIDSDFP